MTLTNVGEEEIENLPCSVHISGGLLKFINVTVEETVTIPVDESVLLSTGVFGGLGMIEVAIGIDDVEPEGYRGFQFIFFTIML